MDGLISKASVLLEALPYIQRFQGETFVVKYGGSFMDSPDAAVRNGVARDVVFLKTVGIKPVVVHGGGKAISRAMKEAGIEPRFVSGLRVTDQASADIVEETLSRRINPDIVSIIRSLGGDAVGFAGSDVFGCDKVWFDGPNGERVDSGFVGKVVRVDDAALTRSLEEGAIPVVSPTARDERGQLHNCNADVAAAQMAIALGAKRLVFMSDVPGLLNNPDDPQTVIPHLQTGDVDRLKTAGIIAAGMIPKVDSAVQAIHAGVDKVSFIDGRVHHSVLLEIFTDKGVGTEIVK